MVKKFVLFFEDNPSFEHIRSHHLFCGSIETVKDYESVS